VSCLEGDLPRCRWVGKEEIYIRYHDEEWGVPVGDDTALFKKLVLEGFQAGLSWITILKKRQRFVECFDAFDAQRMARYDDSKIEALMREQGIVRNRAKMSIAKSLKDRGFRFCGPVGVYALMQSVGMVNDHLLCCHRHDACLRLAAEFIAPEA